METRGDPIYLGEEACLACGGKGVVVGDRCRFCRGTGHCGPAAEMARLRGLLEDGTKGMAILNGEIGRLREENTDLKLVLEETQRRAAQWVNERDWWQRRAERERDAARADADKAWALAGELAVAARTYAAFVYQGASLAEEHHNKYSDLSDALGQKLAVYDQAKREKEEAK